MYRPWRRNHGMRQWHKRHKKWIQSRIGKLGAGYRWYLFHFYLNGVRVELANHDSWISVHVQKYDPCQLAWVVDTFYHSYLKHLTDFMFRWWYFVGGKPLKLGMWHFAFKKLRDVEFTLEDAKEFISALMMVADDKVDFYGSGYSYIRSHKPLRLW